VTKLILKVKNWRARRRVERMRREVRDFGRLLFQYVGCLERAAAALENYARVGRERND